MASGNGANISDAAGQMWAVLPDALSNTSPKVTLSIKRKAAELGDDKYPVAATRTAEDDTSTPAETSRKRIRITKSLPTSKHTAAAKAAARVDGMGMFDSAQPGVRRYRRRGKSDSAEQRLRATSEAVAATRATDCPCAIGLLVPPTTKTAGSKKLKSAQQSAETGGLAIGSTPDTISETPAPVSKKRKAATASFQETATRGPSQKKKGTSARAVTAALNSKIESKPLPPIVVTKEVANKVKQVHQFVEAEREQNSRLSRDFENANLISVPRLSLFSAILRMLAHYEIDQPLEEALRDAENAIVNTFEATIGTRPNIPFVTIDTAKRTKFEDRILEKIGRHGLDEVNLLEIELEMLTKDQLKQDGLYNDREDSEWHVDRFLQTFAYIWEKINGEEKSKDEQTGDDSSLLEGPPLPEESGVGLVCPVASPLYSA